MCGKHFHLGALWILDVYVSFKPRQLLRKPSLPVLCFRFKDTIINAKYGGHTEAVRRLLGQLPISAQSYSGSPYLDLSLFSYDDKWVSVMERPKTCGDHPIRYVFTTQLQTACSERHRTLLFYGLGSVTNSPELLLGGKCCCLWCGKSLDHLGILAI